MNRAVLFHAARAIDFPRIIARWHCGVLTQIVTDPSGCAKAAISKIIDFAGMIIASVPGSVQTFGYDGLSFQCHAISCVRVDIAFHDIDLELFPSNLSRCLCSASHAVCNPHEHHQRILYAFIVLKSCFLHCFVCVHSRLAKAVKFLCIFLSHSAKGNQFFNSIQKFLHNFRHFFLLRSICLNALILNRYLGVFLHTSDNIPCLAVLFRIRSVCLNTFNVKSFLRRYAESEVFALFHVFPVAGCIYGTSVNRDHTSFGIIYLEADRILYSLFLGVSI